MAGHSEAHKTHLKGAGPHAEPHVTKLEREDVQWPGKHNSKRGSKKRNRKSRYHRNRNSANRRHVNW